MSQSIVLDKLILYLQYSSTAYTRALRKKRSAAKSAEKKEMFTKLMNDHRQHILQLQKALKGGHCYGFAICHGAMDAEGKLDWWEDVLNALANWDKKKESLQKQVLLPSANKKAQNYTLQQLFDRVLNYVVYNQGTSAISAF